MLWFVIIFFYLDYGLLFYLYVDQLIIKDFGKDDLNDIREPNSYMLD